MKKNKLSLESFSSYSINNRQSLSVVGGIPTTPPPLEEGPEDGGPIGTGGTGSGRK